VEYGSEMRWFGSDPGAYFG